MHEKEELALPEGCLEPNEGALEAKEVQNHCTRVSMAFPRGREKPCVSRCREYHRAIKRLGQAVV